MQLCQWIAVTAASVGLALAGSNEYKFVIPEKSVVAGTDVKPGEYRVEVNGSTAKLRSGKIAVEASVKMESVAEKYAATSARYDTSSGKRVLQEIRLGGTNQRLVFDTTQASVPSKTNSVQ